MDRRVDMDSKMMHETNSYGYGEFEEKVVEHLKDNLELLLTLDRDEGGHIIYPDYYLIHSHIDVICYLLPLEEIDSFLETCDNKLTSLREQLQKEK